LVLRATVGVTLIAHGAFNLSWREHLIPVVFGIALLLLLTGACLLIGFLTPILSPLAALECLGIAFSWFPLPISSWFGSTLTIAQMIAICVAIAFLGPGAFSLGARLFGWREIVIPPAPQNPEC